MGWGQKNMFPKWVQRGTRIDLLSATGEVLPTDAMLVYEAQFANRRQVSDTPVNRPSSDLAELTFSRFPAEPAIAIESGAQGLTAEIGVLADGTFLEVPVETDQVVFGRKWFPIRSTSLNEIRSWLNSIEAYDRPLTLRALIALRTRSDRPARLLDRVPDAVAVTGPLSSNTPVGLNAELYPYQTQGVAFLLQVAREGIGCVLADEMGLGKTLQVIALLLAEARDGRGPSLVIAPATLLENWRRELHTFAPTLSVTIHSGASRAGIAAHLHQSDVTVVSYETAVRDEPLFAAVQWNVLVLDEAQNIKNPEAKRTLSVKRLPRRVALAVTGTPLENNVEDLWSVLDFALPGMLGDLAAFRREYQDDTSDAERLGLLVSPVLLRRRVADVAKDLPEKIVIPQPFKMPHQLAEDYELLRKSILEEYGAAASLVATGKLRMFCTHPSIVSGASSFPTEDVPKVKRLLEILDEVFANGEKALVFVSYSEAADFLLRFLSVTYADGFFRTIDGRVPVTARQPTVDAFFSHSGCGALILNPRAAGVGLNITAANHVIHYNPEWNPALTDQATARAFRRKQTRPVTVHNFFFVSTVEEVITSRAEFKRQLAQEAVTGHEGDVDMSDIARALQISPLMQREDQ